MVEPQIASLLKPDVIWLDGREQQYGGCDLIVRLIHEAWKLRYSALRKYDSQVLQHFQCILTWYSEARVAYFKKALSDHPFSKDPNANYSAYSTFPEPVNFLIKDLVGYLVPGPSYAKDVRYLQVLLARLACKYGVEVVLRD